MSAKTSREAESTRHKREVAHGVVAEVRPQATSGTFPTDCVGDVDRAKKQTNRELVTLAWPIAAAMLGETAIGLVDTKLVGGLGSAALGGVGLGTTIMFLFYAVVFGLMRGVKIRVSHAIGEGNDENASAYARAGVVMGAVIGVVIMLLCRDVSGVLYAVGTDASIVPYARDFLAAVTLGAPATCALAALIQHRQAIGDSRSPMIVGIAGNAFNALFAWSLIYGHLGLPALGVRGGGYATATTELLELAVLAVVMVREKRPASTISFRTAAREVAELGLPPGLQFGAEMVAFTMFTAVLGSIGRDEIAGHQIALNIIRVSFLPGVAVAEAASVLVGRALGRRDLAEADRATYSALKLAVGFMAACGVLFALGGGLLARFFANDAPVIAIATKLLLVAALFQICDAVNIVLRGSLRGAKDVRVVAIVGIGVVWIFVPTAAYALGKLAGLGALGGWIGFIAESTLAAGLLWLRWTRGSWRTAYVNAER